MCAKDKNLNLKFKSNTYKNIFFEGEVVLNQFQIDWGTQKCPDWALKVVILDRI